ncbi:HlyF [Escherichia coli]|uniref:HlyF n=1 Tax=Escherichia coli TaxID=562 RepID=A0A376ZV01_ECOLX|nr:HlyF [Escherichia coli]
MAKVAGLKRFLHVGTAMSCTPHTGSLVKEESASSETGEHLVEYTHSKATIEYLMRKQCPDLPLLVARPSIIVGHSRLGWLTFNQYFLGIQNGVNVAKIYVLSG